MVDPILSTGLATDWLKRLHNLWSTLRKTREGELQEIQNVFGDPKLLADYYIEPDCQPVNPADHDEDESIRAFRQPVRFWLNRFLEGEFLERDGRNMVFVLSDAGMGKTSLLMMLKLTHLLRFWPDGLDFRLMKLGPDTLEKLGKIQNHARTVLLLDSLDEDPSAWGRIEERLMELLDATKSFRQVILTCRTQFFPEGSAAPIEAPYKVVVGGYICNLLYLSPFDNAQVEAYLRNVYPNRWRDLLRKWWKKEDNPELMRAREVVEPMKSLRLRPMLLAHIDDLMQSEVQKWREFPVYEALVRHWLLRELRKKHWRYTEAQLWELCEEVAVLLQMSGKRVLSPEDLEVIRQKLPAAETLEAFDIGGRSLLNRTSDKGFRFSHYSIQEFLVVRWLVAGKWRGNVPSLRGTDQLVAFLFSWIDEEPHTRIVMTPWKLLDLRDVRFRVVREFYFDLRQVDVQSIYLRGATVSGSLAGSNLANAWMDGATLTKVDLRGANLRAAHFEGSTIIASNLERVDATDADFTGCSITDSDLSFGRFVRARFGGVKFSGGSTRGAAFFAAEGLDPRPSWLDETAGTPSPQSFKASLLMQDPKEVGVRLNSEFGSVSIRASEEFILQLSHPRWLAWLPQRGLLCFGKEIVLWRRDGHLSRKGSNLSMYETEICLLGKREMLSISRSFGIVERWNLDTLQRLGEEVGFGSYGAAFCYGEEEVLLARSFSSGDGAVGVKIANPRNIKEVVHSFYLSCPITCMAWRPGRPVLTFAGDDGVIRVGNLPDESVEELVRMPEPVSFLSWDSTGDILAALTKGGSLIFWVGTGRLAFNSQDLPLAQSFAWSPDSRSIALLGRSREVTIWNLSTGRVVELPVKASAVAWHPGGDLLALAAWQGAIEIWDVSRDVPRGLLNLFDSPPCEGLVITADGYVEGPAESLRNIRLADGLALYDLKDLPKRHDPERVRQAMSILSS